MPDRTLAEYLQALRRFETGDEHALDSWQAAPENVARLAAAAAERERTRLAAAEAQRVKQQPPEGRQQGLM